MARTRVPVLTRLDTKMEEQREAFHLEEGKVLWAEDCADAWKRVNSFMLSANQLKLYRMGNRHIVPRLRVVIRKWGNLIPLETFGYYRAQGRMNRLERNYVHEASLHQCRDYLERRLPQKVSTHGIHFGSGRKATPACMVGGTFCWFPGRLHVNLYLRASEVAKTFGADLHFFDRIIFGRSTPHVRQAAVPTWMSERLGPVIITLDMCYQLAQWFPLIDLIMPGYPLDPYEHRYHRMCLNAIELARDLSYESKWKPERRLHKNYRKEIGKFRTDQQGRVLSGPSFFRRPKKHV